MSKTSSGAKDNSFTPRARARAHTHTHTQAYKERKLAINNSRHENSDLLFPLRGFIAISLLLFAGQISVMYEHL
jgi:hypothetical protein